MLTYMSVDIDLQWLKCWKVIYISEWEKREKTSNVYITLVAITLGYLRGQNRCRNQLTLLIVASHSMFRHSPISRLNHTRWLLFFFFVSFVVLFWIHFYLVRACHIKVQHVYHWMVLVSGQMVLVYQPAWHQRNMNSFILSHCVYFTWI